LEYSQPVIELLIFALQRIPFSNLRGIPCVTDCKHTQLSKWEPGPTKEYPEHDTDSCKINAH
jgi:hypothetical protein